MPTVRRGYRGNSAIHHGPGNSRVVSFSSCFSPVPQSRPRSAAQHSERFPCVFRCRCMRSSSQSSLRSILWRWFWRNPAARSSVPPPDIAAHAPQGFPASNRGNVRIHGASRWLPRGRWFSGCSWWLQCSSSRSLDVVCTESLCTIPSVRNFGTLMTSALRKARSPR